MAVSFKASVDAGVVGASVSGRYNKDVIRNKDVSLSWSIHVYFSPLLTCLQAFKASIQSTIRTGVIYIDGPRFSLDALADIRRLRKNVSPSFFDTYGSYYVDTLKLGADAGVLASRASSESIDSESRDIQVKVRVLWWEIEANYHEGTYSAERWSQFNVTTFDTLTGANVSDASLDEPPEKVAQEYIGKATSLDDRVRDKMEELGLKKDCKVDLETCREIFASGLVVEITLLPYSQLREFVMASIGRD